MDLLDVTGRLAAIERRISESGVSEAPELTAQIRQVREELRSETRSPAAADEVAQLRAEKMQVLGEIASALAHDYNNLLMGVGGCSDIALNKIPPEHGARLYLDEIKSAVARGAGLAKQLLSLARSRPVGRSAVNLDALISGIREVVSSLLGSSIELRIDEAPFMAPVHADYGQLEQLLLNLALNAREVMPSGGTFSISIAPYRVQADSGSLDHAEYVGLTVRDSRADGLASRAEPSPADEADGERRRTIINETVRRAGGWLSEQSDGAAGTFTVLFALKNPDGG